MKSPNFLCPPGTLLFYVPGLQAGDGLKNAMMTFIGRISCFSGLLSMRTNEFREINVRRTALMICLGEKLESSRVTGQLPEHMPHSIQKSVCFRVSCMVYSNRPKLSGVDSSSHSHFL